LVKLKTVAEIAKKLGYRTEVISSWIDLELDETVDNSDVEIQNATPRVVTKQIREMKNLDIVEWFESINLFDVANRCRQEGLDGEVFSQFVEDDFTEIGVPTKGFKRKQFNIKLDKLRRDGYTKEYPTKEQSPNLKGKKKMTKLVKMKPGRIGISFKGNVISFVAQHSQAETAGVLTVYLTNGPSWENSCSFSLAMLGDKTNDIPLE
jgi:hypothetical protein